MKRKYDYVRPKDFLEFPLIENKSAFLAYLLHLEESFQAFYLEQPEYFENHHILMVSIGGTDSKANMVSLRYEDHFIAHYLLYKACPTNREICSAFAIMRGRNRNKTPIQYAYDHELFHKYLSNSMKGENNPNYGNTMSEEGRLSLSKTHKGKIISKEQREEHSKRMTGEGNPVFGKRGIHSEDGLEKIREATTGATWMQGKVIRCIIRGTQRSPVIKCQKKVQKQFFTLLMECSTQLLKL